MSDWNTNFTQPTPAEFIAEIEKKPELIEKLAIGNITTFAPEDDYVIYHGDLITDGAIEFDVTNVIVMGNVKAKVLSLSNEKSGADEGGSFFAYGDVECDYFENHFGKMTVIGGSLKVNKILHANFDNSCLNVHKDVTTEYLHCPSVWINVKGKAQFTYGEGYCMPLPGQTYDNGKKSISPQHSVKESHEFLKIKDKMKKGEDIDDAISDFMFTIVEEKKNNI